MYKHIVVAVDGSNTSLNALQHAASLAIAGDAKLTLVTVANPSEYMTLAPEFLQHESYEAAAIASGNEVLAEAGVAAKAAGVKEVNMHLLVAAKGAKEMAQGLVDYADSHGADLIVIGTHGRTGLMHLLMGSFAETVMRQSHLPLLVIRSVYREEDDEDEAVAGE
ncbi:universal stress protein [Kingella negevensis]|uniref:Universal stress protein n=1 Tax=Kingella negevensis TaxID=1522312 RepID=A0A238HIP5_9NEIS|nr:universal stress protein [Kingella negevensis]MDK4679848.1 universal stress protein [Kingella negevensis]MDK4682433.1 universal stress protein [Kingella negevensis]MDK4685535.1 universal stress protein [Kingella negevensis]MDK4688881.1 universal stress protein [Kingella negevensis]MDK4690630.1 universal stress protein [Kingella negevensis]